MNPDHGQVDMDKLRGHLIQIHGMGNVANTLSDDDALAAHQYLHTHLHHDIRKNINPDSGAVID